MVNGHHKKAGIHIDLSSMFNSSHHYKLHNTPTGLISTRFDDDDDDDDEDYY